MYRQTMYWVFIILASKSSWFLGDVDGEDGRTLFAEDVIVYAENDSLAIAHAAVESIITKSIR